jgi:hypothetical protein
MLNKFVIFAIAVILAAPIYAGTSGSNSTGGSSTGAGGGGGGAGHSGGGGGAGHSGGGGGAGHGSGGGGAGHGSGGGGAGHGGGANGSVGHSGGLSGGAAAATARSVAYGHELSSHGGISPTDAMHATHLAGGKLSEGEHTTSKSPGMDHHHNSYRREPKYDHQYWLSCLPGHDEIGDGMWAGCGGISKSRSGHKS